MTLLSRPLTVVALALGLLIASPGVAYADYRQYGGWTETTARGCPYVFQTFTNDYGQGRPGLHTTAYAYWGSGGGWCNVLVDVEQGILNVRQDLLVVGGSGANTYIYVCNNGPWIPNYGTRHSVDTVFRWASPPCPQYSEFYSARMRARLWDGRWIGGCCSIDQRQGLAVY